MTLSSINRIDWIYHYLLFVLIAKPPYRCRERGSWSLCPASFSDIRETEPCHGAIAATPDCRNLRSIGRDIRCPSARTPAQCRGSDSSRDVQDCRTYVRLRDNVQDRGRQDPGIYDPRNRRYGGFDLERLIPDHGNDRRSLFGAFHVGNLVRRDDDLVDARGRRDAEGATEAGLAGPRDAAPYRASQKNGRALGNGG